MQDWALTVTQLEHQLRIGQLTLAGLTYYAQGPMQALQLLAGMASEAAARQLSAAGLLNMLHARASSLVGDRPTAALMHQLLAAAARPYFAMLERWLCEGEGAARVGWHDTWVKGHPQYTCIYMPYTDTHAHTSCHPSTPTHTTQRSSCDDDTTAGVPCAR